MKTALTAAALLISTLGASQARAELCDYRLSQLVGGAGAGAAMGTAGAVAAGGAGFHAAGLYIIVHSTSAMAMIGSTAAGASAAGTVGIIAGSAGVLGTAASIIAAPVTIFVGGVSAVGAGALEAGCYFTDERITDYDEVLNVLRLASQNMPATQFRLNELPLRRDSISVFMGEEGWRRFEVENLYVVNGELIYRDWGPNTVIGTITVPPR